MKNLFSGFVFALFLTFSLQAVENEVIGKSEKIYLSPVDIQIGQKEIFVYINNNWVQTSMLHSDPSGIYVENPNFSAWLCDRCGRWTTGWFVCEWCGNPKKE